MDLAVQQQIPLYLLERILASDFITIGADLEFCTVDLPVRHRTEIGLAHSWRSRSNSDLVRLLFSSNQSLVHVLIFDPVFTMRFFQQTPERYRPGHWFHVAPYGGGSIPPKESFYPVDACDVWTDGASFVTDQFQVGQSIVIMLFPPEDKPIFVIGEVRHVTATRFGAIYEPVTGCDFTERIADQIVADVSSAITTSADAKETDRSN